MSYIPETIPEETLPILKEVLLELTMGNSPIHI
jgi:hypothetical protein